VLIVEDNALVGLWHGTMLANQGCSIQAVVPSAAEAIAIVEDRPPDLVVLDIHLTQGDGAVVASVLAAARVPFIVVSGYPRDSFPEHVRNAPFVAKPVLQEELLEAASEALGHGRDQG
jgi:CheY-like chemotaxis protein